MFSMLLRFPSRSIKVTLTVPLPLVTRSCAKTVLVASAGTSNLPWSAPGKFNGAPPSRNSQTPVLALDFDFSETSILALRAN